MAVFNGEKFTVDRSLLEINTQSGQLLLGKASVDACLEAGQGFYTPDDIMNVREAIENDTMIPAEPALQYADWSRSDFASHAAWLVRFVQTGKKPTPLRQNTLKTFREYGLSPSPEAIRRNHGQLAAINTELGFSGEKALGNFDQWTRQQYLRYGATFKTRPTYRQLLSRYRRGYGPHPNRISSVFTSLPVFYEHIGYPDTTVWNREDHIEWGVKFMEANDGLPPTSRATRKFSEAKRGPSEAQIILHFGYWRKYNDEVAAQYDVFVAQKAKHEAAAYLYLADMSSTVPWVEQAMSYEHSATAIERGARAALVHRLAPSLKIHEWQRIVLQNSADSFTKTFLAICPHITEADIESVGFETQLYDIIWKFDSHMQTLKLPQPPRKAGNFSKSKKSPLH